MSDGPEFGAVDIGGPRLTPPSGTSGPAEALVNERIKKERAGRIFAWVFLGAVGLAAVTCLCFSIYITCHFLSLLEKNSTRALEREQVASLSATIKPSGKLEAGLAAKPEVPSSTTPAKEESVEVMGIRTFAPLIPASFSTALALIFFITMARFVTNYNNTTAKEDENGQQDYGAIATLVEEIGKVIRTLRGKD